jgi:hypothetical protein
VANPDSSGDDGALDALHRANKDESKAVSPLRSATALQKFFAPLPEFSVPKNEQIRSWLSQLDRTQNRLYCSPLTAYSSLSYNPPEVKESNV